MKPKEIKAIGLLSGGLDSRIALRLILDQDISVKVVNFWTPFFSKDVHNQKSAADCSAADVKLPQVLQYASDLGCAVEQFDLSDNYLEMLHNPRSGYGRNVNPCVDCHINMFETARRMMEREGYDFVFTGEVLGQRPKSQQMQELRLIARRTGLERLILRPMSAKLMDETLPEENGWVDRNRLLDLHGRSRRPQIALAEKYGIKEYPTPAGGCVLTEPAFGNKVKDMWQHRGKESMTWQDYNLLRAGRHLRVNDRLKVVLGRNEAECNIMEGYVEGRIRLEPSDIPGPVVLIDRSVDDEEIVTAAKICARYVKRDKYGEKLAVEVRDGEGSRVIEVEPCLAEEVEPWVIY